jgi:hypothetical protein
MDLDWTHALPFGLVMFAGSVLARLRRKRQRARAERNYPALAERLGLEFEAPRYAGWVGRLRGRFEGYEVLVEPDERPRVLIHLAGNVGLDVRSYDHWRRVPDGMTSFSFGTRRLDQRLPNRFCELELQDHDSKLLGAEIERVLLMSEALRQFTLDAKRLECLFDFGTPAVIPVAEVERFLPALVQLARQVEAWAAQSGVPPEAQTDAPARTEADADASANQG